QQFEGAVKTRLRESRPSCVRASGRGPSFLRVNKQRPYQSKTKAAELRRAKLCATQATAASSSGRGRNPLSPLYRSASPSEGPRPLALTQEGRDSPSRVFTRPAKLCGFQGPTALYPDAGSAAVP